MKIRDILQKHEDLVKKTVTTGDIGGASGSNTLTPRQDLDAALLSIADRGTPFRDKVQREQGVGDSFTFNLRSALFKQNENSNPREMFYGDGGLPESRTSEFYTKSVAYKPIGLQGGVTGLAAAQGRSLVDLYAEEVEGTTRAVVQGEEWLNFWSRTDVANSNGVFGYAGLDELITTNVIDAGGQPISKYLIDRAANMIAMYGGRASDIFLDLGSAVNLNSIYEKQGTVQLIVNEGDRANLAVGSVTGFVRTVAGDLKVNGDFFLNPGNTYPLPNGTSSFPLGATTSTVFILAMPYIWMKDLQALGMEELGRVADKRNFYVNEYTGLKLKAEPWCAKITNVATAIVDRGI